MVKAKKDPDDGNNEPEIRKVTVVGDNGDEYDVDGKKVLGFITNLEKLDKKKDQVLQEMREVYADAKAVGYDNKVIRQIIKERKMEPEKRREQQTLLASYKSAIGMLDDE